MNHLDPLISDLALILCWQGYNVAFQMDEATGCFRLYCHWFSGRTAFFIFPYCNRCCKYRYLGGNRNYRFAVFFGIRIQFSEVGQCRRFAVITALVIVVGMMLLGYAAGRLLHFTYLDSIFLGGMLSMSSALCLLSRHLPI